jgi:amicyanin
MPMHSQRRRRRRGQEAAVAAACAMLLAACGGAGGGLAGQAITPGSGQRLAGLPGTPGLPSPLPTAMPAMGGMPASSQATASPVAATGVSANSVAIKNFAFGPQVVAVHVGATVHWTNNDSEAHTVTSDAGATLNSPVLQPGAGYSHTFTQPGTYSYYCTIHPFMHGKVVVS